MAIKVGIGPIRERPNDATATDGCDADFGTCCLKVPLERIRVPNAPTVVVSVCSSSGSSLVREAVERLVSDLAGNGRRSPMPLVDSASAGLVLFFSLRHIRLRQLEAMAARRAVNQSRRLPDSASIPLVSSLHPKSRSTPLLSVGLVLLGAFLLIGYSYSSSGGFVRDKEAIHKGEGASCTSEVQRAIPFLKKAYGQSMRKVLHIGPDTCTVVSTLLEEDDTEAWGVEPYDLEDADSSCKRLIHALDYLSPKYLNKTLPDLARVSSDGLVIFSGQQRAKVSELAKFGKPVKLRSSSWWIRYFVQTGLQENEAATKKFEQAASKRTKGEPSPMATDFSSSTRRLFRSVRRGNFRLRLGFRVSFSVFLVLHRDCLLYFLPHSWFLYPPQLIYLAVQRCRIAETLCRLSISIRCFRVSNPPFMRISISDTGVGSSLVEFQDLDRGMCSVSSDKWDGMLSITTTGTRDKDIHNYHLNLREALTSKSRLNTLPPTCKNHGTFRQDLLDYSAFLGTEVCFSTAEEDNIDDFMAWVFPFVQKTSVSLSFAFADIPTEDTFASYCASILNLAVDLTVEHTENLGRYNHLLQETDDIYLPLSLSNNERLLLSLKSYVLRHRNALDKECQLCFTSRDHLKFGTGVASNIQNVRGSGRIVEVAIVITSVQSQCCLWRLNYATSQMMYFQEFTPFSVSQSSIDALTSINWQNYGLRLREIIMDRDGNAVLEWVDMPSFGNMDIAIHSDRNLIKKAVKIALDDLKAKYAGTLLSCRSVKIRNHVPDLSRTIASLILSSNDPEFHASTSRMRDAASSQ
ncbi:hypothetical protein MUK42_05173 [Musa troglodytarum]|uniref:Uncharacterized protein n=1 Tax=Musa troglodytarum TaxID=320322 RepID=A0A9E7EKY8_9LILI|nr:hypothetical protein MUK42_05173 [Musa troglodytarum]URD78956.1 hypothetical protein MUK42_05173 [Musa troglodytarum]